MHVMLYPQVPASGGYTAFPRLGVAVRPTARSALFWHNLRHDGAMDADMLHGGCPLRGGRMRGRRGRKVKSAN